MEDDDVKILDEESSAPDAEEEKFEMSPEQATALHGGVRPGVFNRKKLMIVLCISFAVVIGGGMLINLSKPNKNKSSSLAEDESAANTPQEFLSSLLGRSLNRREPSPAPESPPQAEPESLLPPASFNRSPNVDSVRPTPPPPPQGPPPPQNSQPPEAQTHFRSPLVPPIQGSLFSQGRQTTQAAATARPADNYSAPAQNTAYNPYAAQQQSAYAAQNNQQNKQEFFNPYGSGGAVFNGMFLGENSVWTGTVIPGILETAINTDLPGNVLARVTQNVFDSQTGKRLLIPQGTLLLARYNSSISYAQHRVQIVWDTMIRPDGFQLDLEGANGVDRSGMSGQAAKYSENWFEYLKAAGIITLFSIANASMTETAAKHATEASSANIAEANSQLVNQLGESLVTRAMNIQPTLTVDNGTLINIMLNKTLYLPPVAGFPATSKYILE